MKKANRILSLVLITFTLWTCASEEKEIEKNNLLGRWEIQEARRNGRPTESLDNLYFEFFEDGKMVTNLSGSQESAVYEVNEDIIAQRESQFDVDYQIRNLTDSTLELAAQIRDFNFSFSLSKAILEE